MTSEKPNNNDVYILNYSNLGEDKCMYKCTHYNIMPNDESCTIIM